MNIERIDSDSRIVYNIDVRIEHIGDTHVVLQPSSATIYTRHSPHTQWKEQTHITWGSHGSQSGWKAYDYAPDGSPIHHREYDLTISEDVRVEAIAAITVTWKDRG
jgi:hypothetical protein